MDESDRRIVKLILSLVFGILLVVALGMAIMPTYQVYSQRMEGKAILAHAQSSREVAVAEAKAKMESAELLAQADISRARGVAKANEIIGQSLKGNEDYLRYLWIQNLENDNAPPQVIYIPTEAGLPILESQRLKKKSE